MENARILWVDDEIDLLKASIKFLEQKGMSVTTAHSGQDALDAVDEEEYDVIFLDENMPGMSGLETLAQLKTIRPHLPVVMITRSEEDHIMEDAIGAKISDYLIKPVKPQQILSSCKKILSGKTLVSQRINSDYQKDFSRIGMAFFEDMDADKWKEVYKRLTYWELELESSEDKSMLDVFYSQKAEANVNFSKFVMRHYLDWVNSPDRPLLSPDVLPKKVFPLIKPQEYSLFFILVDCLRYDQWKIFEPIISQYFNVQTEEMYFSILPTATQYARNSIFAGMFPKQIAEKFPKYWVHDDEEGGKNLHEADFLQELIAAHKLDIKHSYSKVVNVEDGKQLVDNALNLLHNDFNAVVVNFIDLISHARSEMNIIKELAPDEAALRSLSRSWLEHSALLQLLKRLREHKTKIVITTDHGSIRCKRPLKIIGDRQTTTNLRYKHGRNLNYNEKSRQIFTVKKPADAMLPSSSVSGTFAFAAEDCFFVYPNNYNYYVNYYNDTLQHGGVSLEEMIIPFVVLSPKN